MGPLEVVSREEDILFCFAKLKVMIIVSASPFRWLIDGDRDVEVGFGVATRFKGDCDHAAENIQYPSDSKVGHSSSNLCSFDKVEN